MAKRTSWSTTTAAIALAQCQPGRALRDGAFVTSSSTTTSLPFSATQVRLAGNLAGDGKDDLVDVSFP